MKLEVEYMVETLKTRLMPLIEKGSFEISNIDLTEKLGFSLEKVIYDADTGNLTIIAPDRPEKSAVIGKGGWVVGRLREELGVNSIHVDAYSDMIIRIYRMELAMKKLKEIGSINGMIMSENPLKICKIYLESRIDNLAGFQFFKEL